MDVPQTLSPRTPSPRRVEVSNEHHEAKVPPAPLPLSHLQSRRRRRSFGSDHDGRRSPSSGQSNELSISIPYAHINQEAALSALQYLPMPVIVLSSLKTVILANEAMGRLVCSQDRKTEEVNGGTSDGGPSVVKSIVGQTLSQIGVDMLQGDSPIWIDWESFLDGIANPALEGDTTPKTAEVGQHELSRSNLKPTVVHDVSVEVVLSPGRCAAIRSATSPTSLVNSQVTANMIISVWFMDDSKYYTLTFTSSNVHPNSSTAQSTHTVPRSASHTSSPQSASSSSSSSRQSLRHREATSALSSPTFPPSPLPHGPPSKTSLASSPSILQKATKLREALLNSMNLPCYALWEDTSVGSKSMPATHNR